MQQKISSAMTNLRIVVPMVLGVLLVSPVFAQLEHANKSEGKGMITRMWEVDFSEDEDQLQVSVLKDNQIAPEPISNTVKIKAKLDKARERKNTIRYKTGPYEEDKAQLAPDLKENFNGKPLGSAGIPNDNTMAISNDGIIVSAINTSITILDDQGNLLKYRSLAGIVAGQLGLLDRYYDPKVLYDPVADRFILVFLEGSESSDTRIIVGFTQTNDPTALWNFYQINGRPLGGNTWSDYPIVAHNKEDLFITVNLLYDNTNWDDGFIQSFIWQVNKNDGYNGDTLTRNLFYDINYNEKPVWSICPVQPAQDFDQTNMYFLSVRPDAESNDTVFLHEITNTAKSGLALHKLSVLKSDTKYGVPPSAFQPQTGYRLQTNDTRVLSATLFNNSIHYVQTTLVPSTLASGIYHGRLSLSSLEDGVRGNIISSSQFDYAYPSITFSGYDGDLMHSMLMTFSHSGENDFPGTSIVFHNAVGTQLSNAYSDPKIVKEGDGLINTSEPNESERWGDYTDIQRKYNEPGVVWVCGSYGDLDDKNNVWLARINVNNELNIVDQIIAFPNPSHNAVYIATTYTKDATVNIILTDMKGSVIKRLDQQKVKPGNSEFMVDVSGIETGLYVLSIITIEGEVLSSEKILVE